MTSIRTVLTIGCSGLLLALLTAPANAAGLVPHSAEYRVDLGLISGELNTSLEPSGADMRATHSIKPRGAVRLFTRGKILEQSTFTAGDDGVVPRQYYSDDSLSSDKVRAAVRFDADSQRLIGSIVEEGTEAPVDVALDGPVFDRVSIQYQLMSDLLQDRQTTQYVLYDIDEFKTLEIRYLGAQEITVKAGTFTAVGVQHQAENSSRVTTLWCARELGYLPVLIEQHRKGELKVRATLSKYRPTQP